MTKSKDIRFHIYRYQILPVSQDIQLTIDGRISSYEDLVARKNEFFAEAVTNITHFEYGYAELVHQVLFNSNDLIVVRLGVNRDLKRSTREFEDEQIENWPNVLLAFNNDPAIQKLAIQLNSRAFQHSATIARILERNLNGYLRRHQLHVRFAPIYEEREFWKIVEQFESRIIQVEFEMISPNMSNISQSLALDLETLKRTTNTQETHIQLNSDKDSHLTLTKDDKFVDSLVGYSSEGGGNISMKIKGLKRRIETNNSVTETTLEEVELTGADGRKLGSVFRQLLS